MIWKMSNLEDSVHFGNKGLTGVWRRLTDWQRIACERIGKWRNRRSVGVRRINSRPIWHISAISRNPHRIRILVRIIRQWECFDYESCEQIGGRSNINWQSPLPQYGYFTADARTIRMIRRSPCPAVLHNTHKVSYSSIFASPNLPAGCCCGRLF